MEMSDILKEIKTYNNISSNSNSLYKKLNIYNITGINEYKSKKNNYNNKNIKYSFTSNNSNINKTNISHMSNNDLSDYNQNEAKMTFIKSLIKKPKSKPYDGYACFRKKPSTNDLIKKFDSKENSTTFEENKLCKSPYPLIKFLSNRKTPNHSKELLIDILSAEQKQLSNEQNNDIKYKKYKKPIKLSHLKYPDINNTNFYRKINYSSEAKTNNHISKSRFPLVDKYIFNNYRYKNKISSNRNIFTCLSSKRPCYNNRRIKNSLIKVYCGEEKNLTEHSTVLNNISILKNDIAKKLDSKNGQFNEILKDISVLKSNNHIMAIE